MRIKDKKQEFTFAAAGLCGICLYYLLENIALTHTMASNVGVIIFVAPFFTAVLSHVFLKTEEKLKVQFFIGFIIAMAGICLISFSSSELKMNPIGDILAIVDRFGYTAINTSNPSKNLKNSISIGVKSASSILVDMKVVPHITIVIRAVICPVVVFLSMILAALLENASVCGRRQSDKHMKKI